MVILILSVSNDVHAYSIQHEIKQKHNVKCSVIDTDKLAEKCSFNWCVQRGKSVSIRYEGVSFNLDDVSVIWNRRESLMQKYSDDTPPLEFQKYISGVWKSFWYALTEAYSGIWVSDPNSCDQASSKLLQLSTASSNHFVIPDTIVSNDVGEIKDFYSKIGGKCIVKSVEGTSKDFLETVRMNSSHFEDSYSLKICPHIYQEEIKGEKHLRIFAFGENVHASAIESQDLDWRRKLPNKIETFVLDSEFKGKLLRFLSDLGLRMGIFDFKVNKENQYVFLELNTQGQFLFIEGMTGAPLTNMFSEYLVSLVKK